MIVCEGGDLAGKSTLAQMIAKEYKMEHRHLGRPPEGKRHWDIAIDDYNKRPDLGANLVYDRLVIGSFVYGNYLRDKYNYMPVQEHELKNWLSIMQERGMLLVWAHCDIDDLRYRYGQRGDAYLNLEQIEIIHGIYVGVMHKIRSYYKYFVEYNSSVLTASQWCIEYQGVLSHHHRMRVRNA